MKQTETIPLSFEAVDNLTAAVGQMTRELERMRAAQEDTTAATEQAGKATEEQGQKTARFGDMLVRLNAGVELAKSAYEALGGAVESVSAAVATANEKWDEQSRRQGRAASALGSIAEASTKVQRAQDKVWASLGRTIDRSSVYQSLALAKAEALKGLSSWLDQNSEAVARWGNAIAVWGVDQLAQLGRFVEDNAESLARFQVYLEAVGKLVVMAAHGVNALAKALETGLYAALSGVAGAMATVAQGLADLLQLAGQDVPQALEDLRLGLVEVERSAGAGAARAFEKLELAADGAATAGAAAGDALSLAVTGTTGELNAQIKAWETAGRAVQGYGATIKKNLERGVAGPGAARRDLVDPAEAAEEKRAALLLDYDRRILEATREQNQELALQLQRERALVEARQSLLGIKTSELREATLTVAQLQAQVDYEQGLRDLAAARREDRKAAHEIDLAARREQVEWEAAQDEKARERYDAAMARIAARRDADIEAANAAAEAAAAGFEGLGAALGAIDEATARVVDALERGVGASARFGAAIRALTVNNKSLKESANEVNAAIEAGAGVASSLVAGLVDNAKTRAKIEAAINAAAAVAATAFGLATGNPSFFAAAAGHATAAAKYGLLASGVFDGGGGGGVDGGGGSAGGSAAAPLQTLDLDRERTRNAEAIAEALAGEGRGGGVTIEVNLSGALIAGESPQAARAIVDLIAPELARSVGRA